MAIVGVTIFVKVSEGYFNMTKNDPPPKLLKLCCSGNRKRANRIYIVLSCTLLMIGPSINVLFNGFYLVFQIIEDPHKLRIPIVKYIAYTLWPMLISVPLTCIMPHLATHCDKGEYVSITADQRPLDPHD